MDSLDLLAPRGVHQPDLHPSWPPPNLSQAMQTNNGSSLDQNQAIASSLAPTNNPNPTQLTTSTTITTPETTITGQTATASLEEDQEHSSSLGEDTLEEMLTEDDAFVAWCIDNSPELNTNDPTRRYYINKLYQPMNGQQQQHQDGCSSALAEQEEEDLFYEELRRIEKADERQRVQLPKILDDDDDEVEGDDGGVDHLNHRSDEDPLDRLQLTTIIESFDSFLESPHLIDSGAGRDPLISEASNHQDKPDSTREGAEFSPTNTSNNLSVHHNNNHHHHNHHHHHHHHHHHQQQQHYDCHQQQQQHNQDTHFLTSINSDTLLNNESHHNYPQHHHQQQEEQTLVDMHHDEQQQYKPSENSCFHQVSSTFMPIQASESSETASPASTLSPSYTGNNNCHHQHQETSSSLATTIEQSQGSDSNKTDTLSASPIASGGGGGKVRKRCLQQVNENGTLTIGEEAKEEAGRIKVKAIRKKKSANSSPCHNVTSTMTPTNKSPSNIYNTTTTTNECQKEHIIANSATMSPRKEEADQSMADDCNSTNVVQPQMTKYRRRTANARERIRMREINQAFERLKKVVPVELIPTVSGDESDASSSRRGSSKSGHSPSDPPRLTKITTLRLAVSYIAKLSEVLSQHPEGCPMTIPSSSASASNSSQAEQTQEDNNNTKLKTKKSARKRRGGRATLNGSSNKQQKLDAAKGNNNNHHHHQAVSRIKPADIKLKLQQQSSNDLQQQQQNKGGLPDQRLEKTIVLSQNVNQVRPFIFTGNMLQHQQQQNQITTFAPLQQNQNHLQQNHHQQSNQQQQLSIPSHQFAYVNCNQQPMTISQTTTNNNGQSTRTMVTPVAVAILGIQTASNNNQGGLSEAQPLRILGIRGPQQQQHHQQLQARPQQLQQVATTLPYNLIATQPQQQQHQQHQQPQQVTFTLGQDANGMSVLRLANPQDGSSLAGQPIQLQQQSRPIIQPQQQQPQILTATTTATAATTTAAAPGGGYNYATTAYQPIQNNNEANIRQLVATLATSIHPQAAPTSDRPNKSNAEDQARTELKQQQTKRTYRFHNYDGNMITNHL